jgi:hypothetical protein
MNKLKSLTLAAMILAPALSFAGCPLCEQARENNKNHPEKNYVYYEDYLKAQDAEQAQE